MRFLSVFSLFVCVCALSSLSAGGHIRPKQIIERARAKVGSERALDGLTTLQFVGRIDSVATKVPDATIVMIARKPCSQRLEVRMGDIVESTILHGAEGCVVRTSISQSASQMRLLVPEELLRIKFSTRQFFSFFRPHSKKSERVSYQGIESYRGVRSHKLVYQYPDGMKTIRYFSVVDDNLIATVTDSGVESVGIGEQIVEGIKFPQKLEYYENGQMLHAIIFTDIKVNKPLTEGIFDIPTN